MMGRHLTNRGRWWLAAILAGVLMAGAEVVQDQLNDRRDWKFNAQFAANNQTYDDAQQLLLREISASALSRTAGKKPDVAQAPRILQDIGTLSEVDPRDLRRLKAWQSDQSKFYRLTSESGGEALLGFFGGEWGAVMPAPLAIPTGNYAVTSALSVARTGLLAAWVVVFALLCSDRFRRPRFVEVLLMISVACVLCYVGRVTEWRWHGLLPQAGPTFRILLIPLSLVVLLATWWLQGIADLRKCQSCGYDLFANTSGMCPECGKAIPINQRDHLKRLWESPEKQIDGGFS